MVAASRTGVERAAGIAARQTPSGGIYAGDPEQLARLIEDNEGDDREPRVDIWTFYPDAGPRWLSCHYRDTPVFFARELPSGIRGCRAGGGTCGRPFANEACRLSLEEDFPRGAYRFIRVNP